MKRKIFLVLLAIFSISSCAVCLGVLFEKIEKIVVLNETITLNAIGIGIIFIASLLLFFYSILELNKYYKFD